MEHSRKILVAKFACVLGVIPAVIFAYASGPPERSTGAPGDQSCFRSGCHQTTGGTLIQPSTSVRLDIAGGLTYTPGAPRQQWTVTINDAQGRVFGFQATARLSSNEQGGQAGAFTAGAGMRVLCEDGREKPAQGCPSTVPVEFIEHTMPRSTGSFTFEWTPPATNVGDIKVYVAANAANGNGQPTGDRIHLASFTLTPAASQPRPTISSGGVSNAWSFQPAIADSAWISIYGTNLAPNTRTWRNDEIVDGKLPTQLDGVGVKINNRDAFVYFISPGQINIQAPSDGATGPVTVQVTTPQGTSEPATVTKQAFALGLFTWFSQGQEGAKYVGAVAASDGLYIAKPGLFPESVRTRPARPDEFVLLFGTGFGPTDPAIPAGQVVASPARMNNRVTARIGGVDAEVFENTGFLIFAGEYQFNVRIPANLPDGDHAVELEVGGVKTQGNISITVQR